MIDKGILQFGKDLGVKTVIGIVIGIILVLITFKYAQVEAVEQMVLSLGVWGPIILIFAKVLTLVVAPINGTPLYILGSVIYGPLLGSTYLFIGDMIGASVSFLLARVFGQDLVYKFFSQKEEALIPKILESMSSVRGLVIVHAILVTFPDIINYVSGLSKVKFKTFFLVHIPFALFFSLATAYTTGFILNMGSFGPGFIIAGSFIAAIVGLILFRRYGKALH